MRHILILALLMTGCSPSLTNTSLKTDLQNPKPGWLNAKPNQDSYYVGIGHSNKDGTNNYIQSAKKSALEDMVSEIKVNISSTSVLSQIDANKEFQERYEQIINTTAADEIEEFEQVDSWQDDLNYWVYYRLSKQRYKDIKDEQKRNAVTLALDFFTKAKQSERSGENVQALGFYFQGFRSIEKYLAEPIRLEFEGKEILLTNEIIASIQQLLDKIQLSAEPSEIMVNRRIAESGQTVMVKAFYKDDKKVITDLPLIAAFEKGSGDVYPNYKTDVSGHAKMLITKISSRDLEQTVAVKVDLLRFAGENPSDIYKLVAQKSVVPKTNILLKVQRPLVYITADEKSLGYTRSNQQLTNKLKNFLTNSGFELTDAGEKAELWMDVKSDSEKGAVSGSIYIAYVTSVIKVVSLRDNKEIYATTLDRVKGYSLDFERASQEAYNKSLETLEREKLAEILNSILQ
ncbi:MAG: LPP20 family lipoprotein [Bacteroidia bacterium]|nr:LPP20 family lipoprotein [Bacteroidia bacterium]